MVATSDVAASGAGDVQRPEDMLNLNSRDRLAALFVLWVALVTVGIVLAFQNGNAAAANASERATVRPTTSRGIWDLVFKAGQRWILPASGGDPARLVVETFDLRRVEDADVVRLRWLYQANPKEKPVADPSPNTPTQLARTRRGVYFLRAEQDDRAIALALKSPPTNTDPPRLIDSMRTKGDSGPNVTRRRTEKGDVYCFGYGPGKDAGECEDVCFGEFCVSPEAGIVEVGGTFAPGYDTFRSAAADR
jgi:hypothetical protein